MIGPFLVFLMLGLFCLTVGVMVRNGAIGSGSRLHQRHEDPSVPAYFRNGVFALIPLGTTLLICAAGVLLRAVDETLATTAVMAAVVLGVVGLVMPLRPPAFTKPRWLRSLNND